MTISRCMRGAVCSVFAAWLAITASRATTIAGGNIINQTWTAAGNPYIVQGDVTIPSGAFLNINAGTIVQFASSDGQVSGADTARVELIVKGTLTVSGTAASPVTFQAQSGTSAGTWYGIEVNNAAVSASITHAHIQHAVYGIQSSPAGTILNVSYTTIDTCMYGVSCTDGNTTFDAVSVTACTNGFYFTGKGFATLTNVIAASNSGYGIYGQGSTGGLNVSLNNATAYNNTNGGIRIASTSAGNPMTLTAQNLIVASNGIAGIYRDTSFGTTSATVTYSDVWNNLSNYVNAAPGVGSISSNPSFVAAPTNLHVTAGSVIIDAGSGGTGVPNHDFDGNTRPLDGDGIGGVQYDMGAYEFVPAAILGAVPEVNGGPQPVLTIGTPDHGATLNLQWGAACGGGANDYAVYEGSIGAWYSHVPGLCTTSGSLSASYAPGPGNKYYVVVPLNASSEGIYGHASSGAPIPVSGSACRASQNTAACP